MIKYTLDEAIDFRDRFFKTAMASQVRELTDPRDIIERTIRSNLWVTPNMIHQYPEDKYCRILFDLSLEEIVPLINEPEPCISFIEWRLKLGK